MKKFIYSLFIISLTITLYSAENPAAAPREEHKFPLLSDLLIKTFLIDITKPGTVLSEQLKKQDWNNVSGPILHRILTEKTKDELGATLLHIAAYSADLEAIKKILELYKTQISDDQNDIHDFVNIRDNTGSTPLIYAAAHPSRGANNLSEIIKELIAWGAEINAQNNNGNNAFSWAVITHNFDIADLLLKKGADINITLPSKEERAENQNYTLLHVIPLLISRIRANDTQSVSYLLGKPNLQWGVTKTIIKISSDQDQMIQQLLDEGYIIIDPADYNIVRKENEDNIQFLLAPEEGANALIASIQPFPDDSFPDPGIVLLLIYHGKTEEIKQALLGRALGLAMMANNRPLLQALFERWGINKKYRTPFDVEAVYPIEITVAFTNLSLLAFLIYNGAVVPRDPKNPFLIEAFLHPNNADTPEIIGILVAHGAPVDVQDRRSGNSPLHYAAYHGYFNTVQLLIVNGANINHVNQQNETVLDILNTALRAAHGDRDNLVAIKRWLLRKGAKTYDEVRNPRILRRRNPKP